MLAAMATVLAAMATVLAAVATVLAATAPPDTPAMTVMSAATCADTDICALVSCVCADIKKRKEAAGEASNIITMHKRKSMHAIL